MRFSIDVAPNGSVSKACERTLHPAGSLNHEIHEGHENPASIFFVSFVYFVVESTPVTA